MFQYISCCSLSIIPNTTDSGYYCFNTSHVVVYRAAAGAAGGAAFCFNTSHVVVYRYFLLFGLPYSFCFNTSHVVVYLITGESQEF